MTGVVSPGKARPISGPGSQLSADAGVADAGAGDRAYYRYLATRTGQAADNVRSMSPQQLDQLTGGGVPHTAEQVINLGTGTTAASPDTVAGYDRQQAVKSWLAGSASTPPPDWQSLASNLSPVERAKLDQTFQGNKPRSLGYLGQQVGSGIASVDTFEQHHPGLFPHPAPGSWAQGADRKGWAAVESVPAGAGQFFDDGLTEIGTRTRNAPATPMPGETPEHFEQRVHPFTTDARALGKSYSDELTPIAHGFGKAATDLKAGHGSQALTDARDGFTPLWSHTHDDPVGTALRYYPAADLLRRSGGMISKWGRSGSDAGADHPTPDYSDSTKSKFGFAGRKADRTDSNSGITDQPSNISGKLGFGVGKRSAVDETSVGRAPDEDYYHSANTPPFINTRTVPGPKIDLYHGTGLSGARNIVDNGINPAYTDPKADFGQGFYTTTYREIADARVNNLAKQGQAGAVLHYRVSLSELNSLNGRFISGHGQEWQDFVRAGRFDGGPPHDFDWIEGELLFEGDDWLADKIRLNAGKQQMVFYTQRSFDLLARSLYDIHH